MPQTQRALHVDVPTDTYPARLRNLAHKARTTIEESGANHLYLAPGTLEWKFDARPLRLPLILVPVVLTAARRGRHYRIRLDESGMSSPNYCQIEKLRQTHGLEIPGLDEPALDDAGIDLDAALDATRRAIAECGLPFRVEATAELAILQFSKFRLWKDLDENWAEQRDARSRHRRSRDGPGRALHRSTADFRFGSPEAGCRGPA